jgi:uncharacterized protein YbgA (DUF1722 family)
LRIWDISAGYLNRHGLLGEHRELHGVYAIVTLGKTGYSRHPETLRWMDALSGLARRHAQLAAEMRIRGYVDRTPLPRARGRARWPAAFVTEPAEQLILLRDKYHGRSRGRIPLPRNVQELWAHHKYSAMARDPAAYRQMGRLVARARTRSARQGLARDMVAILRETPSRARLVNALEHMWGHVSGVAAPEHRQSMRRGLGAWLSAIQLLALQHREPYLLSSTALSELWTHATSSEAARDYSPGRALGVYSTCCTGSG